MNLDAVVPMVAVSDVSKSIQFYSFLGFSLKNQLKDDTRTRWACLEAGACRLMLVENDPEIVRSDAACILYLYVRDAVSAREQCIQEGINAGELIYPAHSPDGEFQLNDPDGHTLMITHV